MDTTVCQKDARLLDEGWFRACETDALGSVKDCNVGCFLDKGRTELLEVAVERYEDCQSVEYDTVALGTK